MVWSEQIITKPLENQFHNLSFWSKNPPPVSFAVLIEQVPIEWADSTEFLGVIIAVRIQRVTGLVSLTPFLNLF